MTASHTQGAFSVLDHNGVFVLADNALTVAQVSHMIRPGEQLANAYLFAAAPDLLQAAQKTLAHLNARIDAASAAGEPVPLFEGIADLHAAIAKATGEGA